MVENAEHHFFNPELLFKRVGISAGMRVGDFGCGRDVSLIVVLGKLVTNTGQVYALDIVKDVLQVVGEQVKMAGVANVQTLWTDLEVYGAAKAIPDGSLDAGLLVTTLFYSKQPEAMVKECLRMIKMGGKLFIADWKPGDTAIGPPAENRIDPLATKKIVAACGAQLIDEFEVSEYHWGLLFQK